MSDPTAEPGAPTDGATNIPPAQEKSIASEVKQRVPNQVVSYARTPDRVLLRLNKLLATPGGLSAFLSTFNYTLYLLAYLEASSVPTQARLYNLLSRLRGKPTSYAIATSAAGPSRIAALGALISQTRVTLRLFGLLPMYAWFRQLMQGPKPGQDQILYATSLTQCSLYMTFQFLENVALLTDKAILPATYTDRWTAKSGGTTAKISLWAYRAWFAGVLCDFVRLGREAQISSGERSGKELTTEDKEVDARWWSQLVVPASWTPVAAQFATEGGYSWFNLGIMGACGTMAGLGRTADLWAATADE